MPFVLQQNLHECRSSIEQNACRKRRGIFLGALEYANGYFIEEKYLHKLNIVKVQQRGRRRSAQMLETKGLAKRKCSRRKGE